MSVQAFAAEHDLDADGLRRWLAGKQAKTNPVMAARLLQVFPRLSQFDLKVDAPSETHQLHVAIINAIKAGNHSASDIAETLAFHSGLPSARDGAEVRKQLKKLVREKRIFLEGSDDYRVRGQLQPSDLSNEETLLLALDDGMETVAEIEAYDLTADVAGFLFGHGRWAYFALYFVGGYLMFATFYVTLGACPASLVLRRLGVSPRCEW